MNFTPSSPESVLKSLVANSLFLLVRGPSNRTRENILNESSLDQVTYLNSEIAKLADMWSLITELAKRRSLVDRWAQSVGGQKE
jgi:hypothetical protein